MLAITEESSGESVDTGESSVSNHLSQHTNLDSTVGVRAYHSINSSSDYSSPKSTSCGKRQRNTSSILTDPVAISDQSDVRNSSQVSLLKPTKRRRGLATFSASIKLLADEKNRPRASNSTRDEMSLPRLIVSRPSEEALLVSENESSTGELDLNVSPATFVKTIVLQAKSSMVSLRGEDVISDASRRVSSNSYFLKYTSDHLEAYTNDKVDAVRANDIVTLRSLQQQGHVMQASNRFGESVLHTSCRRGFTDIVKFFVEEAGVSVRVRDDMGRTPMHDACWSSATPNFAIMKILILAAPEMLLSKDKRGHSPFDYARREYWPHWVTFLNEHRQIIVDLLVSSCMSNSEHMRKDESERIM